MSDIFLTILKISLTAIPIIAVIYLIKVVARNRMPRSFHYALWLILLLRLLIPVEIPVSVGAFDNILPDQLVTIPVAEQAVSPISDDSEAITAAAVQSSEAQSSAVSNAVSGQPAADRSADAAAQNKSKSISVWDVCAWIWAAGVLLMLAYYIIAYLRIKNKIRKTTTRLNFPDCLMPRSILPGKRFSVVCCKGFDSPFVFGLIRPIIVIPYLLATFMDESDLELIIQHETSHIKRYDVLVLHVSLLIRCVYWFNPLIHIALNTMKADQEAACDASVVKQFESSKVKDYANVLISVASCGTKSVSVNISEFGKGNMKRRIGAIMKKKRYTRLTGLIAAVIITAVCIFVLTTGATGKADSGAAADTGAVNPVEAVSSTSPSPSASMSIAPVTKRITAVTEDYGKPNGETFTGYTLLKVTQDDGNTVEMKYDGAWISHASTGDINNDGNEDVVLYLEYLGSSGYGMGEVHVLYVDNNQLVEYPQNYNQNPDNELACPESFDSQTVFCGAEIVNVNDRDLLRAKRQLMDSMETAIQYIDASYTGEGWLIEDTGMLIGNAPEEDTRKIYDELPSTHREGFEEADLMLLMTSPGASFNDYYDIMEVKGADAAQSALQQLYDMTGYQVKECYMFFDDNYENADDDNTFYFSMDKDDFNSGTFLYYTLTDSSLWNLHISYKNDGTNSPIDATEIAVPDNMSSMSDEEIAKWYYENSTFGDRRAVVRTEANQNGFIRLYLEDGDFYEVTLNASNRVIQGIIGPYEAGFEH